MGKVLFHILLMRHPNVWRILYAFVRTTKFDDEFVFAAIQHKINVGRCLARHVPNLPKELVKKSQ